MDLRAAHLKGVVFVYRPIWGFEKFVSMIEICKIFCGTQVNARVAAETRPIEVECKRKGIVITGGTKGLGYALAREFLAGRDNVVICGRNEDQLAAAIGALQAGFPGAIVDGIRCDVSNATDVAALASFAAETLGTIHFWLNNAGSQSYETATSDCM